MNLTRLQNTRIWLNRTLEATWLAAILLIPLVVLPDSWSVATVGLPKTVLLRIIASVAAIAWLGRFAIWSTEAVFFSSASALSTASPYSRAIVVLDSYSKLGKLVILSVIGLAIVNIASTLFSIDPTVSFWGKRAGYEGYGLYNTLTLMVLFFTVSARLRTREQLWRLVYVAAAVGVVSSLIGILQSLGAWPVTDKIYLNRVSGHSGNPIAYGSLIGILFPFGVLAIFKLNDGRESLTRLWLPIVATSFVFMYAIALTLSRGPYLGTGAAIVALVIVAWWGMGPKMGSRFTASLFVSGLLVALLMLPEQNVSISQPTIDDSADATATSDSTPFVPEQVDDRITNTATVSTRLEIWRAAQGLITERPGVPDGPGTDNTFVRHLFGYGPDQFRYVVGLTAERSTFYRTISEAHNDFIQRLVELGVLGLISFVSVLGTVAVLLISALQRARTERNWEMAIIVAAISAALGGWLIQQQAGIPRNSDLTIFWVMLGVVVALPRVYSRTEDTESAHQPGRQRVPRPSGYLPAPQVALGYSFAMVLVTLGIVGALVLAWDKNIDYVRADHSLRLARDSWSTGSQKPVEHFARAVKLAPDIASFRTEQGDYFEALAELSVNPSEQLSLTRSAHEANLAALEINRLERGSNFHVAESAWALAQLGYGEQVDVALDRYRYLREIAPEYRLVQERLALLQGFVDRSSE